MGRVVDTISHSKDWKDSAIFVLEDDFAGGRRPITYGLKVTTPSEAEGRSVTAG